MTNRVTQGLIALAISLATAGAIATSTDWSPPDGDESAAGAILGSEIYLPERAASNVPIRSARLSDELPDRDGIEPVTVRVAGIALEAPVIPVGVDDANQFAVPAADTVGWYRYSAEPGRPGASVLAAHVDYGGVPGAFFNLEDVLPGDTLEVELEDGTIILYEVIGNTVYDKTELPADELFRKDGEPVLQLITCGGTFDPNAQSYVANVVVTAIPIAV
ncbi:MAG: class F sortase [Acidimicrobiales bacterium]